MLRASLQHKIISPFARSFSRTAVVAYDRKYNWITPESEELISKAYSRHQALSVKEKRSFPPAIGIKDLESPLISTPYHYTPKTIGDRVAYSLVAVLEKAMHLFFREKYDHHAVTLETVAAVPGYVAALSRHLRSLRSMKRDHGWINTLQEEAENERMHLLTWMQMTEPRLHERVFVMVAQALYVTGYGLMYTASPKVAHRMVGYLEESALRAYNDYLAAVDSGAIPNRPAPEIAKHYYRLAPNATLRDVILCVRADEAMHRDFNHQLSDQIRRGGIDEDPLSMEDDLQLNREQTELSTK
mmetsp:Transcript_152237/g.469004  ORF Transcript_152237/g.469004 Transcript_152237/m.469004 type:complete len:300 (-) Transcript_152237:49-948(-)